MQKRQSIISNFENHLNQIKVQMREDALRMAENNEIAKENQQLKDQYEALVKEIDEKSVLMEK